jgi:hypothetical protein
MNMLIEVCENIEKASLLLDELTTQLVQGNINYLSKKGAKLTGSTHLNFDYFD